MNHLIINSCRKKYAHLSQTPSSFLWCLHFHSGMYWENKLLYLKCSQSVFLDPDTPIDPFRQVHGQARHTMKKNCLKKKKSKKDANLAEALVCLSSGKLPFTVRCRAGGVTTGSLRGRGREAPLTTPGLLWLSQCCSCSTRSRDSCLPAAPFAFTPRSLFLAMAVAI